MQPSQHTRWSRTTLRTSSTISLGLGRRGPGLLSLKFWYLLNKIYVCVATYSWLCLASLIVMASSFGLAGRGLGVGPPLGKSQKGFSSRTYWLNQPKDKIGVRSSRPYFILAWWLVHDYAVYPPPSSWPGRSGDKVQNNLAFLWP